MDETKNTSKMDETKENSEKTSWILSNRGWYSVCVLYKSPCENATVILPV